MRGSVRLTVLVAAMLAARASWANPMETFGYTSRAIGMGGGATASAASYESCFYNPAGLGMLVGPEAGVGVLVYRPFLTAHIHQQDPATGALVPVDQKRSDNAGVLLDVGFGTPIPLGDGLERVLFFGFNLVVPGTTLYAVRERPATEATFPFLEDRNRRLVLNAAVAIRPWKPLMIGAGFSLLPDVFGDVKVDFTQAGTENATSVDVAMHLSPNVGILAEPMPGLTLGLTWRGANRTYLSIPVHVKLSQQYAAINVEVTAYDYSTPHELAFGIAWHDDRWSVAGDFTYSFYRQFHQSAPAVQMYDATGNVTQNSAVPDPDFHDAMAVRLGAEWKATDALAVRLGFGWVQSPVPAQTGDTNLLDGDRYTVAGGVGYSFEGFGVPISLDAHIAWAGMVSNRDAKATLDPTNPGYPSVSGTGSILNSGLTAKVWF